MNGVIAGTWVGAYYTVTADEVRRLLVDLYQLCGMHINVVPGETQCLDSPTCSFPLKTYNLQFFVGFLASGGSWYLSTTPVTSGVPALDACSAVTLTVLLSAARRPEFAKLGLGGDFARSGGCWCARKKASTRRSASCALRTHASVSLICLIIPPPITIPLPAPVVLCVPVLPRTFIELAPAVLAVVRTVPVSVPRRIPIVPGSRKFWLSAMSAAVRRAGAGFSGRHGDVWGGRRGQGGPSRNHINPRRLGDRPLGRTLTARLRESVSLL